MKKNYEAPQIEVIEIEIEDAVLAASGESETSTANITTQSIKYSGSSW